MPYIDFDHNDINKEALKKGKRAIREKTNGEKDRPDTDELWELFYEVYQKEGGKVVIIEDKGDSTTAMLMKCSKGLRKLPPTPKLEPKPEPEKPKIEPKKEPEKPKVIPPLTLKIVELTFLSDHGVIRNNTTDWENTGELYEKPDWTPAKSNPVSHSMKKNGKIQVVIEAEGEAPDNGEIKAKVGNVLFFQSGTVNFKIGKNTLVLTSVKNLSEALGQGNVVFKWTGSTTRKPEEESIGKTKNLIFVTYSDPIRRETEPEDGFTVYRMAKSIKLIKASNKTELHPIVKALMNLFKTYTLEADPAVPANLEHPFYSHKKIGAWALRDYIQHTAECQAICRFVRGIMEQVCVPNVVPTVVWAVPTANDLDYVAHEAPYGFGGLTRHYKSVDASYNKLETYQEPEELGFLDTLSGKKPLMLTKTRTVRVPKKETWMARLTTSAPTDGEDATDCGLNTFEACLKFTDDKAVVKYYGGGAGVYDSKESVVKAFHSLVWVLTVVPKEMHLPTQYICKKAIKIKK